MITYYVFERARNNQIVLREVISLCKTCIQMLQLSIQNMRWKAHREYQVNYKCARWQRNYLTPRVSNKTIAPRMLKMKIIRIEIYNKIGIFPTQPAHFLLLNAWCKFSTSVQWSLWRLKSGAYLSYMVRMNLHRKCLKLFYYCEIPRKEINLTC